MYNSRQKGNSRSPMDGSSGLLTAVSVSTWSAWIVGDDQFQGTEDGHDARGDSVQMLADRVLQDVHVNRADESRHANRLAEVADRLGRVTAAPQAANRRHAWIVPARHVTFVDQLQQPPLAHHRVGQIQPGELDLDGMVDLQLIEIPVVQRSMVLEFQRANRVRDALDRVGLAVREIVHRIDAPFVAGAMVMRMQDAIHHRIAHVQVG